MKLPNTTRIVLSAAAIAMLTLSGGAQAGTFNVTIGSDTFTIVEADRFRSGDTAGNTVRAGGGGFWSSTANDDTDKALLKHFNLIGPPSILFYDSKGNARPELNLVGFKPADEFVTHIQNLN